MKKICSVFLVFICLSLCSCRHPIEYAFLHSTDEISDVSIVSVTFTENGELVQTEIVKVEDVDAFIKDFKELDCYEYYGDPIGITEEGGEDTVIKIHYKNGEYELINWSGQSKYTLERGFHYYSGYSVFDEAPFEAFLATYLDNITVN